MYPIDKTNMDVLRFAHFIALAVVTVRFIPRGLARAEVALAQTDDFMRSTLARNLLPRHFPVVSRPFRDFGNLPLHGHAGPDQRVRHPDNDCGRLADHVVQHDRGARFGEQPKPSDADLAGGEA